MINIQPLKTLSWTRHSQMKMTHYGLSESRVKRILRCPHRIEEGIAEDTLAMMQSAGSKKNPYEIWVMVQDSQAQRTVISAWRYPGKTKPGSGALANILSDEYGECFA